MAISTATMLAQDIKIQPTSPYQITESDWNEYNYFVVLVRLGGSDVSVCFNKKIAELVGFLTEAPYMYSNSSYNAGCYIVLNGENKTVGLNFTFSNGWNGSCLATIYGIK